MMLRRLPIVVLTALAVMALSSIVLTAPAPALAQGATQIAGSGAFAGHGVCADPAGAGSDFALSLTGDLQGCLYAFVKTAECAPSGTYKETGDEIFVGQYNGQAGTFRTTYRFEAKYQDCPHLTGDIFGRSQHPLVAGSGEGVFAGVTGRFDFKDNIEAGNFSYTGHLRW